MASSDVRWRRYLGIISFIISVFLITLSTNTAPLDRVAVSSDCFPPSFYEIEGNWSTEIAETNFLFTLLRIDVFNLKLDTVSDFKVFFVREF